MYRELEVVNLIQKCCRGYIHRRKIMIERNEQKAEITYQYFKDIDVRMRTDLHYKLMLRYKIWQNKMRIKRMKAAEKKEADKKKNKYGSKFKKAGTTVKTVNAITKPVSKAAPSTTSVASAQSSATEPQLQTSQTLKLPI